MFTEPIAQRDQSRSPVSPSSSKMRRCGLTQNRAAVHPVKRRCTVGPDGAKAGGTCRQVQPVMATKMIGARASWSPYRLRPCYECARRSSAPTRNRINSAHRPFLQHEMHEDPLQYGRIATVWLLRLFLLAGPVIIGIGSREAALQRRLLREGIRTDGLVVRHRIKNSLGKPIYFAVVSFVDAQGNQQEFESDLSGVKGLPVSSPAPVLYLPGAPKSARLDLSSKRIGGIAFVLAIGIVWTALPIWLLSGSR